MENGGGKKGKKGQMPIEVMPNDTVISWVQGQSWMDELKRRVGPKLKRVSFGPTPPNVFVGEYGYPEVRAGPLLALDEGILDSPKDLYGLNFSGLLHHRSHLAHGYSVRNVKRIEEGSMLIAASEKKIDVEATFERAPAFSLSFSHFHPPVGPSGKIEKLVLADNPTVPKRIDTIIDEKLKVNEALPELMGHFDYHYIQKILSAGILGQNRKIVPTKWSITATDDMMGKQMLKEVREFTSVNEYRVYSNKYLFNHFEILLLPGAWEFEQFESFENKAHIAHEYEPHEGRTKYAQSEGGGYYAGRFGVVDSLHRMKRQARAIVFREVSPEYTMPFGVWQVRSNVMEAFSKPPFKTGDFAEAVDEVKRRLKQPWSEYYRKSRILTQKKLIEY